MYDYLHRAIPNGEMENQYDLIDKCFKLEKALDKACEMIGKQICEDDNVLDCPKDRPEKCDLKCKECWKEYLLKESEKQ